MYMVDKVSGIIGVKIMIGKMILVVGTLKYCICEVGFMIGIGKRVGKKGW